MKPTFATLAKNYPRKKLVDRAELYQEIGWEKLINDPAYHNTCAVRVSLALIKSGMPIQGRMPIKTGPYKGKLIEPGQARLAQLLTHPRLLGQPKKLKPSALAKVVGNQHGIIVFWKIPDYRVGSGLGGHIDIISPATGGVWACGSSCYLDAAEIWFWALP